MLIDPYMVAEQIASAPTVRGVDWSDAQNEAVDDVVNVLAEYFESVVSVFDVDRFIAISRGLV